MDSGITKYDAATGVAAYLILMFDIIAIYNVMELSFMIWGGCKRHAGLYFWAFLVATYGIAAYAIGFIGKTTMSNSDAYIYLTLIEVGWIAMVTGQSMVLWSRLHFILRNPLRLRMTLWMIVSIGAICHIPTVILTYGTNAVLWGQSYSLYGTAQVTLLIIQELIISGIYLSETFKLLRRGTATREPRWCGHLMQHLIVVNIVVMLLDTTILALVYAGYYDILASYQSFVYSAKLKLEFTILNRLGDSQAEEKMRWSIQEVELSTPKSADGYI